VKSFVFTLLLALIFSNVFFMDVRRSLVGDGYDNYEFFGFMHLAKENLLALKHPFAHTNTLRYPDGFDFSYGFDGALAVLSGAVLSMFFSPILSYNLTVAVILFLNIFISLIYFRRFGRLAGHDERSLTGKALMAALVFGASPYVFARINGHLNLAFVAGVPVFAYYYASLNKNIVHNEGRNGLRDLVGTLIGTLLIGLGSLQYLILLAATSPFILALTIKQRNLSFYKSYLLKNAFIIMNAVSLFILFFIFIYQGYFRAMLSGDLVLYEAKDKYYEPHIVDVLVPNRYLGELWGFINPSDQAIERVITLGTLELGILLYVLIKLRNKNLQILGFGLFLVYLFLSFNIWQIPYYPEGGRTVILLCLFLGLVLVSDDRLFRSQLVVTGLLAVMMVERLFYNVQVSEPLAADVLSREVSSLSGEAVLNIPLSKYTPYKSALPVFYEKKVLDGFFHYTAATSLAEKTLNEKHFSRLVCQFERDDQPETGFSPGDRPEALDEFKAKDIAAIVVFKEDEVGKLLFPDCYNVRDWWHYLNPPTQVLSGDTPGVVKNNFTLPASNPHTLVRFYFERAGKFYLNGLLLSPNEPRDLKIVLPSGEEIRPAWEDRGDDLAAQFTPPIEIEARPGDFLTLISNEPTQVNRFINAYYAFQTSRTFPGVQPIPLELLYSDSSIEIYKVNW